MLYFFKTDTVATQMNIQTYKHAWGKTNLFLCLQGWCFMTLSPRSWHLMMHRLIAVTEEQSWLRQHNCTWRGVKVWTTVVLGGFLMEVSAIPSRSREIGVGDLGRVSELCTGLGTKLASLIQTAIMMRIVSMVSMLCVLGVIGEMHFLNIYFNPLFAVYR